MTNTTARVRSTGEDIAITIWDAPYVTLGVSSGGLSHVYMSGPADVMRALVAQLVAGLAELEVKP